MYERWLHELWNGPLDELEQLARGVVTDDFVGHWPGRTVRGPDELAAAIREGRTMFEGLRFEIVLGPIAEGNLVAARWVGRGTFQGSPSEFHGHDMLRADGDRFAEYWPLTEDPTA
jgi:hypothetical protein